MRWLILLLLATTAWGKAPPDWLKPILAEDMAALSRGKVAVRLLDSGDVRQLPDNRVKRVTRGAIRVLTDLGRQRAACAYHFNADTEKVIAARAWVVTPDGKKAEEFGTREFADTAMKIGAIFWPQQRTLSYSATASIPIGSVFAWEFEAESQSGIADINWVFPTDLATLLSVIEVTPAAGGKLAWHATGDTLPEPIAGAGPGALRWEKRRYTSTSTAGDRPAGFLATPKMLSVRCLPANASGGIQTWADLATLSAGIIEPRMTVSPELKAKAEALTAGRATRWDRVRALAEFVQKEITYLSVVLDRDYLAGYRPHAAAEVLQNRHGDCKDKAALFVTMLRALGDSGHLVLVAAGNPRAVQPDWPSARFNHAIAGVPADGDVPAGWPVVDAGPLGRLVLFDATDPSTPFGVLSAGDQGGFGLVASPASTGLIALPIATAEMNRLDARVRATLDERGDLKASVEEVSSGTIGVMLHASRENLRAERFTPLLETRLRETLSFLEELHWKDAWEGPAARWTIDYDFKAPRYARRTGGNLMLVSPQVVSAKMRMTPWKTKIDGVVWSGASQHRKEVRLTLPENVTIEELPDDWSESVASASCRLRYRREGRDVIYDYELAQPGGFLDQPAYEALRLFFQKVQEAERRPVLLREAAVTGGDGAAKKSP